MPRTVIDLMDVSSSPTYAPQRHGQVRPNATDKPQTTTLTPLEEVISNSTLSRLQGTLREICRANAAAANMIGDLLLVPAQSVTHLSAEESSSEEESSEERRRGGGGG